MKQVHTQTEGRKSQGQHQHTFAHTWNKFTHLLRAGNHKDSISTHCTHMERVHTPTEGRKPQGEHQYTFAHTWNKFTHSLRVGNHKDSISTHMHTHGTSSHTL